MKTVIPYFGLGTQVWVKDIVEYRNTFILGKIDRIDIDCKTLKEIYYLEHHHVGYYKEDLNLGYPTVK